MTIEKHSVLVSIVVPIYMVEKYIRPCIDSVIAQTYYNIEIILVDDGSLDDCGKVCDDFAQYDSRIQVIHKKNGGLSDARNEGVANSNGAFIFFLDGDDWILPTCIQELVKSQIESNADVVQCGFYYTYDNHWLLDERGHSKDASTMLVQRERAIELLIQNQEIKNFAWGKLVRSDLATRFPFPKGRLFEDTFWTHNLIGATNFYLILREPLLCYRQREGSISYSSFNERCLDRLDGMNERKKYIDMEFPNLSGQIAKICLHTNIELFFQSERAGTSDLSDQLLRSFKYSYRNLKCSFHTRWKLALFNINPRIFVALKFLEQCKDYIIRLTIKDDQLIRVPKTTKD